MIDMARNAILALLPVGCLIAAPVLAQETLMQRAQQQFKPIPEAPPELPGNPASPAKVALGALL
jgi:cytochrome c peroxidase